MRRVDSKITYTVLFVDDEDKAQKYFRMAFAGDFPVRTVGSVPEALGILDKHSDEIAVLITDQRMPGQQGVDLLKQAREQWPAIVRLLTTAYSDLDDAIAAVNRGEIWRYVTKPWDIEALRVELRHAMDYFLLRRERDLLLAEKLSVRERMAQSDRLVGLLAIAAGLENLRHAPYAIAAWARDAHTATYEPVVADRELWGAEVQNTLGLMQMHRRLHALDDLVQSGFPDRTNLTEQFHRAGLAVQGDTGEVATRGNLLDAMVSTLVQLTATPIKADCKRELAANGSSALTLMVTGRGMTSEAFRVAATADEPEAGLLAAYLIAWHHGGALKASILEGQSHFVLTLPEKPEAVVLPKLDESTLLGFFSMLEDWQ